MNPDTVLTGFDKFMAAVRGIDTPHIAKALGTFTPGTDWCSCSKYRMAECYGHAVLDRCPGVLNLTSEGLRRMDLGLLAMRARACAQGREGWQAIGSDASAAALPGLTVAEIAAELFKAPMLEGLRRELHDVSRSLLRTEDKLRSAEGRSKELQAYNAALLALVEQAAVPGGIGDA
ncbi:hypothetical protein [Azohydromonas aeria]|uniref:hypothetical protein n=1 Tax=Azohydromonas aeria TaxID=2590212 RepID=UPI0012FBCD15|nr:hypothetical protein [Azohydromonas aeria]